MIKKIGLYIVLMLLVTVIPIVNSSNIKNESYNLQLDDSQWYHNCYIEVEGVTYAAHRNLFLPHFLGTNNTLCLYWIHRFDGNAKISIYRNKDGNLLHDQNDLQEFHMFGFFGIYNYQRDPFILKGRALAIKTFTEWTPP
jgi:hypothetical protein